MKRASLLILTTLLISAAAYAQAPAAPATPPQTGAPAAPPQTAAPRPASPAASANPGATGGIAVIDFMKAVTENSEGKRATNRLMAENTKRMNTLTAKQKEGQDAQAKLQSGDKVLSDSMKADLAKQIDRVSTEITRMQDDYNKEMQDLQQQQLSPVAAVVKTVMEKYAEEKGYALVLDTSAETSNIVFRHPAADITDAVIVRVDEETAKNPPKPGAPAPGAAPGAPAAPKPATPAAPKPPTPDPAKKP